MLQGLLDGGSGLGAPTVAQELDIALAPPRTALTPSRSVRTPPRTTLASPCLALEASPTAHDAASGLLLLAAAADAEALTAPAWR